MKRNILIAICLVLLAIVLMKAGPIGYMLSISILSLPNNYQPICKSN